MSFILSKNSLPSSKGTTPKIVCFSSKLFKCESVNVIKKSALFLSGPKFDVPTKPHLLNLRSLYISSLKYLCSGPSICSYIDLFSLVFTSVR